MLGNRSFYGCESAARARVGYIGHGRHPVSGDSYVQVTLRRRDRVRFRTPLRREARPQSIKSLMP